MSRIVSVVGLGYVGLPVAVAFGKKRATIGFDINEKRIGELKKGIDLTHEVSPEDLISAKIEFSADPAVLKKADFHIVAVPTPVDQANRPDLSLVERASATVGRVLKRGDIVVFESTVYPGATEEVCIPILERESGLKSKVDFWVGYSPERINPGDREHTFTKIKKVVSAQDAQSLEIVAETYGSVVDAGVFRAKSIAVAEAAKVIENTQRDLNVALMNELALIFDRLGIRTRDVLEAASTKWNFLKFTPGLVGGHCIGVDPYYLTHRAEQAGYNPQVVLAGRRINDDVGKYIAQKTIKLLIQNGHPVNRSRVAILGLTFKENCPDLRNTKVIDIVRELAEYRVELSVIDPQTDSKEALHEYGLELARIDQVKEADAVIFAVSHREFLKAPFELISKIAKPNAIIIDVKSALDPEEAQSRGYVYWSL